MRQLAAISKKTTTVQCIGCGAPMVLERIQPDPDDAHFERHEFRCEICSAEAFFKFKVAAAKRD